MASEDAPLNRLLACLATPIAELGPELSYPSTRALRGEITITWPFNQVTNTFAFILAEPDVRKRRAKGQVRIQLQGPSAGALAQTGCGGGDELLIALDGAEWSVDDTPGRIPGARVDWQIHFPRHITAQVKLQETNEVKYVHVEPSAVEPPLEASPAAPAISVLESTEILAPELKSPELPTYNGSDLQDPVEYQSPAFMKRARMSYGALFEDGLDIFEEDGGVRGKGRKRSRFGRESNSWRYTSQSRSPEPAEKSADEDVDEDEEQQSLPDATPSKPPKTLKPPRPVMTDEACQTTDLESIATPRKETEDVPELPPAPADLSYLANDTPQEVQVDDPMVIDSAVAEPVQESVQTRTPPQHNPGLANYSLFGTYNPNNVGISGPAAASESVSVNSRERGFSLSDQVRFGFSHEARQPEQDVTHENIHPDLYLQEPIATQYPEVPEPDNFGAPPVPETEIFERGHWDMATQAEHYNSVEGGHFGIDALEEGDRVTNAEDALRSDEIPPSRVPSGFRSYSGLGQETEPILLDDDIDESSAVDAGPSLVENEETLTSDEVGVEDEDETEGRAIYAQAGDELAEEGEDDPTVVDEVDQGDYDQRKYDAPSDDDQGTSVDEDEAELEMEERYGVGDTYDEDDASEDEDSHVDEESGSDDEIVYDDDDEEELQDEGEEVDYSSSEAEDEQNGPPGTYLRRSMPHPAPPPPASTEPIVISLLDSSDEEDELAPAPVTIRTPVPGVVPPPAPVLVKLEEPVVTQPSAPVNDKPSVPTMNPSAGTISGHPLTPLVISPPAQGEPTTVIVPKEMPTPLLSPTLKESATAEDGMADQSSQSAGAAPVSDTAILSSQIQVIDFALLQPAARRGVPEEGDVFGADEQETTPALADADEPLESKETGEDHLTTPEGSGQNDGREGGHEGPKEDVVDDMEISWGDEEIEEAAVTGEPEETAGTDDTALPARSMEEDAPTPLDEDVMENGEDIEEEPLQGDEDLEDVDMQDDENGLLPLVGPIRRSSTPAERDPDYVDHPDTETVDEEYESDKETVMAGLDPTANEPDVDSPRRAAIQAAERTAEQLQGEEDALPEDEAAKASAITTVQPLDEEVGADPVASTENTVELDAESATFIQDPAGPGLGGEEIADKHEDEAIKEADIFEEARQELDEEEDFFEEARQEISEAEVSKEARQDAEELEILEEVVMAASSTLLPPASDVEVRSFKAQIVEYVADNMEIDAGNEAQIPQTPPMPEVDTGSDSAEGSIQLDSPSLNAVASHVEAPPMPVADDDGQSTQDEGLMVLVEDSGPPPKPEVDGDDQSTQDEALLVLVEEDEPLRSPSPSTQLQDELAESMIVYAEDQVSSSSPVPNSQQSMVQQEPRRSLRRARTPVKAPEGPEAQSSSPASRTRQRMSATPDPSVHYAKQSLAAKGGRKPAVSAGTGSSMLTRARSSSQQTVATTEDEVDQSIALARASIASPSKTSHKNTKSATALKGELSKRLAKDLPECLPLKSLRSHVKKAVTVVGIVAAKASRTVRAKTGPRDYVMSFHITDVGIAPTKVIEVQLLRASKDALPKVSPGDGILLENVQVQALAGKGFGLRSDTSLASAWAVFDRADGLPQIAGPPVEDFEQYADYMATLKEWYRALGQPAIEKLAQASKEMT